MYKTLVDKKKITTKIGEFEQFVGWNISPRKCPAGRKTCYLVDGSRRNFHCAYFDHSEDIVMNHTVYCNLPNTLVFMTEE